MRPTGGRKLWDKGADRFSAFFFHFGARRVSGRGMFVLLSRPVSLLFAGLEAR
jgi:hypothetical protein